MSNGVKLKKKPKNPKQAKKEAEKELTDEQLKKVKEEHKAEIKAKEQWEKDIQKYDAHTGIIAEEPSKYLENILDDCVYALEKKADKYNVAKTMMAIAKYINQYAKPKEAGMLGVILMKIAAKRPDTWKVLQEIAAKDPEKGGPASWAVHQVEKALKKRPSAENFAKNYVIEMKQKGKQVTMAEAYDIYLTKNFGGMPDSRLAPDEMMSVIGMIENQGGKSPLKVTKSWLNVDMKLLEEASLLVELSKRKGGNVSYDFLTNVVLDLNGAMTKKLKSDLYVIVFGYALGDKSVTTLDDAILKAYQHSDVIALAPPGVKEILKNEKITDLKSLIKALQKVKGKENIQAAQKIIKNINSLRKGLNTLFEARKMIFTAAGPQLMKEAFELQTEVSDEARRMIHWNEISEAIKLFGTKIVKKLTGPWVDAAAAWKTPISKTGTWRYRKTATWRVTKQLLMIGGAAIMAAAVGYGLWYFFKKKPTDEAIKTFKDQFIKDFGIEFPLSDKAIKFYFAPMKEGELTPGQRALNVLQEMYPTSKTTLYLLSQEVENADALKTNVMDASGYMILPSKFQLVMEDFYKAVESGKEPEAIIDEKIATWKSKGYLITAAESYIYQFCTGMGIKDVYAKEFMKNEKAFIKMWSLIKEGKLPRALAPYYAKIAMGTDSYEEKKKKLDAVTLSQPIPAGSLMDVLDQYAVALGGAFRAEYLELLKLYKKDKKARKNLNDYKIKPGEAIYGNVWGLIMLGYGVARGEVTAKNDPHKGIISGTAKFVNEKGVPKKWSYWVYIGDDSIMRYLPGVAINEKQMEFVLTHSGIDEDGMQNGMAKWLVDFAGKLVYEKGDAKGDSKATQAVAHFSLSKSVLKSKYYDPKKKTWDYEGIYSFLNGQIDALKDKGIYVEGELEVRTYLVPTDIFATTGGILSKSEEAPMSPEVEISPEISQSEKVNEFLLEVDGMLEMKDIQKNTHYKKAVKKQGSAEKIMLMLHDLLLKNLTLKSEGKTNDLDKWGIAVLEDGTPYVKKPDKFKTNFLVPTFKKLKK